MFVLVDGIDFYRWFADIKDSLFEIWSRNVD